MNFLPYWSRLLNTEHKQGMIEAGEPNNIDDMNSDHERLKLNSQTNWVTNINNYLPKGRTFTNFALTFSGNIPDASPHSPSTYVLKYTSKRDWKSVRVAVDLWWCFSFTVQRSCKGKKHLSEFKTSEASNGHPSQAFILWLQQAVTHIILCNATFTYTDRRQCSLDSLYLVKEEIQTNLTFRALAPSSFYSEEFTSSTQLIKANCLFNKPAIVKWPCQRKRYTWIHFPGL